MIEITNTEVFGWKAAIRGMRNPLESWEKSDSLIDSFGLYELGENDIKLMRNLVKAGTDHSKFLRMIHVQCDINAPIYWWKEFDTYKVGTVRNSCSTMHKIHSRDLTEDDFSFEHWTADPLDIDFVIENLNRFRKHFIDTKDKDSWYSMIELLPSAYNQKATIDLNYQVLRTIYHSDRKHHKLDEWRVGFMEWIESLPYSKDLITE